MTITQASRSVGTLTGSMSLIVTIDGDLFQMTSPLTTANVTQQAQVSFTGGQNGVSWVFSGALVNHVLSGRHTLLLRVLLDLRQLVRVALGGCRGARGTRGHDRCRDHGAPGSSRGARRAVAVPSPRRRTYSWRRTFDLPPEAENFQ